MKRFVPDVPDGPDSPEVSHSFAKQLLVRVAIVVSFPVLLWMLSDPATALLTLAVFGLAGLLLVGVLETGDDDGKREC